jgi:hypothetical protein
MDPFFLASLALFLAAVGLFVYARAPLRPAKRRAASLHASSGSEADEPLPPRVRVPSPERGAEAAPSHASAGPESEVVGVEATAEAQGVVVAAPVVAASASPADATVAASPQSLTRRRPSGFAGKAGDHGAAPRRTPSGRVLTLPPELEPRQAVPTETGAVRFVNDSFGAW